MEEPGRTEKGSGHPPLQSPISMAGASPGPAPAAEPWLADSSAEGQEEPEGLKEMQEPEEEEPAEEPGGLEEESSGELCDLDDLDGQGFEVMPPPLPLDAAEYLEPALHEVVSDPVLVEGLVRFTDLVALEWDQEPTEQGPQAGLPAEDLQRCTGVMRLVAELAPRAAEDKKASEEERAAFAAAAAVLVHEPTGLCHALGHALAWHRQDTFSPDYSAHVGPVVKENALAVLAAVEALAHWCGGEMMRQRTDTILPPLLAGMEPDNDPDVCCAAACAVMALLCDKEAASTLLTWAMDREGDMMRQLCLLLASEHEPTFIVAVRLARRLAELDPLLLASEPGMCDAVFEAMSEVSHSRKDASHMSLLLLLEVVGRWARAGLKCSTLLLPEMRGDGSRLMHSLQQAIYWGWQHVDLGDATLGWGLLSSTSGTILALASSLPPVPHWHFSGPHPLFKLASVLMSVRHLKAQVALDLDRAEPVVPRQCRKAARHEEAWMGVRHRYEAALEDAARMVAVRAADMDLAAKLSERFFMRPDVLVRYLVPRMLAEHAADNTASKRFSRFLASLKSEQLRMSLPHWLVGRQKGWVWRADSFFDIPR